MDVVRAIDFIYQLPQTDRDNIFAEGGSQGGAFTLVSAALDNRVAAIAPYIPFLSDYPDYFNIVHWPADPVKGAAAQAGVADDAMYKMLSYFDIKTCGSPTPKVIQSPYLLYFLHKPCPRVNITKSIHSELLSASTHHGSEP